MMSLFALSAGAQHVRKGQRHQGARKAKRHAPGLLRLRQGLWGSGLRGLMCMGFRLQGFKV